LRAMRESLRPNLRPVAIGVAMAAFVVSCGVPTAVSASSASSTVSSVIEPAAQTWTPAAVVTATDPGPGQVVQSTFYSAALNRTMTYVAYLPPGYDANSSTRYPTLYMLHGGSGYVTEWVDYGLLKSADTLMRDGTIAPMIVVLPEGDQEYWVDHVVSAKTGANGEKWGTCTRPTTSSRSSTRATTRSRMRRGARFSWHFLTAPARPPSLV